MLELKYFNYAIDNPLSVWIVSFLTSYVFYTFWFFLLVLDKNKRQLNSGLTLVVYIGFTLILLSFVLINSYNNETGAMCYVLTLSLYFVYIIYTLFEEPLNQLRDSLDNNYEITSHYLNSLKPLRRFFLSFRLTFLYVFGLFVKIFIFMIVIRIFIGISSFCIYTRIAAFFFLILFLICNYIRKKPLTEYLNFGIWDLMK